MLIQGSCFLAWCLTFGLWTEIATSIYHQLAKSTLWWPRALQLAACAVYGLETWCCSWIRSLPLFPQGFCGLGNGKHLASWRRLVPVIWQSDHHQGPHWYQASFQGRRGNEVRAALLSLGSAPLFWSLKKPLQILRLVNAWWLSIPLFSHILSTWCLVSLLFYHEIEFLKKYQPASDILKKLHKGHVFCLS